MKIKLNVYPASIFKMKASAMVVATLVAFFYMFSNDAFSQGKLLGKLVAKVSKATSAANVVTTPTIEDVMPTVGIASNLHPVELGTISQSFFPGWSTGGQQVFIMFTKRNAPGFFKIDGSVKVNGQEIEYVTSGMYSIIGGTSNSPRKVDITSSSGQKSSFVIEPAKNPIKLVSINGKDDKISLDLSKDVVLEVQGIDEKENPFVKVSLALNQVGIKSIYDVCFIRSGSKLTIPAAAFRNINIVPGGNALYNYKKSFLSVTVESVANASEVSGSIPSVQYTRSYMDGMMVNVTTEPALNTGITAAGEAEDMDYNFFKPGAFTSRSFSQVKKVGVISLSIRGLTRKSVTISSNAYWTKSAELTFPKQPNEVWDALLEKLYPELMEVVKSELKCEDVPLENITGSGAYMGTEGFAKDDENTTVSFARSFRNTKVISAFMPVTDGYGVSGVNQRIMNETGTDGLLTMTLDLELSFDEKDAKSVYVVMIPKFAVEMVGKANGNITNTKYFTGTIKSSKGVNIPEKVTPADLDAIIRRSDLITVFRKGLHEIIEKEKANGDYEVVWALQK